MAIDPSTLEKQRLSLVQPSETKCDRCGQRTRDKTRTCMACRRAKVPKMALLTTAQLSGLIAACRAELERRRAEIDVAIGGKP